MADNSDSVGGLTFDKSKRQWPNELNVFAALILIVIVFEILGAIFVGQSLLFDTNDRFDSIFNEARLRIIIIQVAIVGIIALGVTQVIITAGIDLSSGSVVGGRRDDRDELCSGRHGQRQPQPQSDFWRLGA